MYSNVKYNIYCRNEFICAVNVVYLWVISAQEALLGIVDGFRSKIEN